MRWRVCFGTPSMGSSEISPPENGCTPHADRFITLATLMVKRRAPLSSLRPTSALSISATSLKLSALVAQMTGQCSSQ